MEYFLYIIKSQNTGKFYTGITINLEKRLREHNKGKNKSTKNQGPFILVYKEIFETRVKAREREKFFKSGEGREFRNQIIAGR